MSGRRLVAVAALVALSLVACGDIDSGVVVERADSADAPAGSLPTPDTTGGPPLVGTVEPPTTDATGDTAEPTGPVEPVVIPDVVDFGSNKPPRPYDDTMQLAFADVEQFWADNYEALYGSPWEPVAGIYAHYPERPDDELPESCEGPVDYEQVEGNAFYTSCGDIIVYDDAVLIPELVDKLGESAAAVVAAHEYGHAIQERAGVFGLGLPTVETEQQADCFAGAWTAHVARGESDLLQFDDAAVKGGLVAMIEVRDPPGLDVAADENGHGSAFDRVGAFQVGFLEGLERCATFPDDPNPRIDLKFITEREAASGGDLPFDEILAELPTALDTFWLPTLEANSIPFTSPTLVPFPTDGPYPECGDLGGDELSRTATYCPATNTIAYDDDFARQIHDEVGDLAFAYPIAIAYSDAVQAAIESPLEGEERVLLNDCLVGAWIVDIVPAFDELGNPVVDAEGNLQARNPEQQILLSAGDLDEAVITAVIVGDEAASTNRLGTAFDKIDAFRSGVLGGIEGCQARLD
jgi:predicted metalloprotease